MWIIVHFSMYLSTIWQYRQVREHVVLVSWLESKILCAATKRIESTDLKPKPLEMIQSTKIVMVYSTWARFSIFGKLNTLFMEKCFCYCLLLNTDRIKNSFLVLRKLYAYDTISFFRDWEHSICFLGMTWYDLQNLW